MICCLNLPSLTLKKVSKLEDSKDKILKLIVEEGANG